MTSDAKESVNYSIYLFKVHIVCRRLKARSRKQNIIIFYVNRGDKLLCFYTIVVFENIGFRAFFRAFSFA